MPGIRHVRNLTDIETLQNRKDILRPGGDGLGSGFDRLFRSVADVHVQFRSIWIGLFEGMAA
jgi:hypothetical protein